MTDKEKILKYLNLKGISKNKFYKTTGFSVGFLDKGSSLGVDKLKIIVDNYHDFNPFWLITEGNEIILDDKPDYPELNEALNLVKEDLAKYVTIPQTPVGKIPFYDYRSNFLINSSFHQEVKPDSFIELPSAPKSDGAFMLVGSYLPEGYNAGDIVLYKKLNDLDTQLFYGKPYLIEIENEDDFDVVIMYLEKSDKGENFVRASLRLNQSNFKDLDLNKMRTIAAITGKIQYNSMN